MAKYLLIESRDPFESGDVNAFCRLATELSGQGNDVTFFLVQNALLMTRNGVKDNPLGAVLRGSGQGKLEVLADDFGLKERGIQRAAVVSGVKVSNVDHLVDILAEPKVKAIWH